MLQAGSLGYTLRWSLVLGCVSGVPLGSTLWNQEGRNRVRQREGSSWITGPDDLSWPYGGLEWRWHLRVVLTHPMTRPLYLHLDGSLHVGCPQRGWWFKVAHWQHLQLLDNESLKGGQDSTSPCPPSVCIKALEVGGEGVLWGTSWWLMFKWKLWLSDSPEYHLV